jgi:DNA-binding MarR family transcriptional regulator
MNEEKPLGAEIRMTSNAVKNYIDLTLESQLKDRLTGIEGLTMGYLFKHEGSPVTAKDIMERSHSSKATTSQTLHGLEVKGYIKMVPSKDDKRVKVIELTDKGEEVHREFGEIFKEISRQVKQGITPEDEALVRKILKQIQANVGMGAKDL